MSTDHDREHTAAAERPEQPGWRPWIVLAAIMLPLIVAKIIFSLSMTDIGIDGGLYTDVARHVRDGMGLKTSLSLYHKGFPYFPHPTSLYPLWPLVYGYTAKVFPLLTVAIWLPTFLFFTTLILAYMWGTRFAPGDLFPKSFRGFNAGHVLVLIIAQHPGFFQATSMPYTEGLTYTICFGGLILLPRALDRPGFLRGLIVGLWLGATMMTRSQMALVAIALFMAVLIHAAIGRRRLASLKLGFGALVGFSLVLAPYLYYISTFLCEVNLTTVLRYNASRVDEGLSVMPVMVKTHGLWDRIVDIAGGFKKAYGLMNKYTLYSMFHALAFAAPFALVGGCIWLWRKVDGEGIRGTWNWIRSEESLKWTFYALLILGAAASLHTLHKVYGHPWYFSRRQGFIYFFTIFAAIIILLKLRGTAFRTIGIWLLCASTFIGTASIGKTVHKEIIAKPDDKIRPGIVKWVNQKAKEHEGLVLAITHSEAERFAHATGNVGYHWLTRTTTLKDIEYMFDNLNADYLLMSNRAEWKFHRNWDLFRKKFRRIDEIAGVAVFEPR